MGLKVKEHLDATITEGQGELAEHTGILFGVTPACQRTRAEYQKNLLASR